MVFGRFGLTLLCILLFLQALIFAISEIFWRTYEIRLLAKKMFAKIDYLKFYDPAMAVNKSKNMELTSRNIN